jgi:polyhydroxybutyrate depolymerase
MRSSVLALASLSLACSIGCSSKSDSPASTTDAAGADTADTAEHVFGGDRAVEVRVPEGYDPKKPAPLLLMLHGFGAGALSFELYLKMINIADAHGFFYVAPEGTVDAKGRRFWNADDACCDEFHTGVDDVKYLTDLVKEVQSVYSIDPKRIYVLGHSNGGFMANRLACDRAEVFAAVVSFAGAVWSDASKCNPSAPVGFLQIHGTADADVLYAGDVGTPPISASYPGAEQTVATWGMKNGCAEALVDTGTKTHVDADMKTNETSVLRHEGCKQNGSAELWKVDGGPHIFAFAPEALEATWKFLSDHAKP